MESNSQFQALKAHVDRQLSEHRASAAMTGVGRDWVRGWDDPNKPLAAAGAEEAAAETAGKARTRAGS